MRDFDEILEPDVGVPSERHKSLGDRTEFHDEPRFEQQVIERETAVNKPWVDDRRPRNA